MKNRRTKPYRIDKRPKNINAVGRKWETYKEFNDESRAFNALSQLRKLHRDTEFRLIEIVVLEKTGERRCLSKHKGE